MSGEIIEVGICTFRRETIRDTLASLAAQRLPQNAALRVIVADNDDTDIRRGAILDIARGLGLDLLYVHAPARNISIARNACLDAARCDWFAFIDDDEIAEPDWLAQLMAARDGHDIVFGVSQAVYAQGAPQWMVAADLHSNRLGGNDPAWNGYTANVLLRRAVVAQFGLRFVHALGQTGGEDTLFFFDAHRAGARFGYAPDAIVREPVPAARTRFRWLALRRFRSGQIHQLILKREGRAMRGTLAAALKAGWCLASAPLHFNRQGGAHGQVLRGAMHAGVVAAGLGQAPYREYARPDGAAG